MVLRQHEKPCFQESWLYHHICNHTQNNYKVEIAHCLVSIIGPGAWVRIIRKFEAVSRWKCMRLSPLSETLVATWRFCLKRFIKISISKLTYFANNRSNILSSLNQVCTSFSCHCLIVHISFQFYQCNLIYLVIAFPIWNCYLSDPIFIWADCPLGEF